jgi:uncharacterized surface protein with fasciclin (FAS1) repeats
MKNVFNLKKIALLMFVAVLGVSCSKSDDAPTPVVVAPKSITAIATANPELSTLVKALVKAELSTTLDGTGTYTVFAPTNKAFTDKYGAGFPSDAIYTKEAIAQILLNHVLIVKKNAADLKTEYVSTMATGPAGTKMSLYVDLLANAGKVTLNGKAIVESKDIQASNGVIHIVDSVITLPTLVEAAAANPSFKTLVKILTSTATNGNGFGDQSAVLAALGTATTAAPFTVLAPTDAAFTSATGTGGFITATTTPAQVGTVLKYHVITIGNVQSSGLMDAQVITTFGTQKLKVVKTTTSIKFEDQAANRSNVLIPDVQCANGIIHAIDRVLQPAL